MYPAFHEKIFPINMKTNRFIFLLILLAFVPAVLKAQQTVYYQSVSPDIQKARELYLARNYISALNEFEQIASKSGDLNPT